MNFSINMTYDNTLPYEARIDAIKDAGHPCLPLVGSE